MKLNLKWVADEIGDTYKTWRKGEIVLLNAQTGTGKTHFIKNVLVDHIEDYEKILLVCNRTNLKRQLKRDLLLKYGLDVPESLEDLDKITTIANIIITSYHAIQDSVLDQNYNLTKQKSDLGNFGCIILDEAHFIFTDSSFNNKCRISLEELIRTYHRYTTKIFISATMDEIKIPINNYLEKLLGKKPKVHDYTTGTDYSYVNPKYFRNIKNIIANIKNDTTDDKWLVFVSNFDDADKVEKELGSDICSIIKSGTKSEELSSIINNSKFEKKVLVATKTLDNGINIEDEKLKNIVIMAYDKTTFIQMLGRKRIDINNAQTVNLYIHTRYKKSFSHKLLIYNKKQKEVELYQKDKNLFNRKYDNNLKSIGKLNDLFYRGLDGNFKLNTTGRYRLVKDKKYAEYMVSKFEAEGEFAFVTEQLSWLGLEYTFDESNLTGNIILNEDVIKLEDYLESLLDTKVLEEDQIKLKELLTSEAYKIDRKLLQGTKKMHPDTFNSIMEKTLKLPYKVTATKTSKRVNDKVKKYTYWTIVKTFVI